MVTDAYFIKYEAGIQEDVGFHYDQNSRISISMELTDTTTEMEFPLLNFKCKFSQGEALLFMGGCPVYLHKPSKTTVGERITLVIWLN